MTEKAFQLHKAANKLCYIANSCNFPIYHKPTIKTKEIKDVTQGLKEIRK